MAQLIDLVGTCLSNVSFIQKMKVISCTLLKSSNTPPIAFALISHPEVQADKISLRAYLWEEIQEVQIPVLFVPARSTKDGRSQAP